MAAPDQELHGRQLLPVSPPGCPAHAYVYPANPENVGEIPSLLRRYEGLYEAIRIGGNGPVVFYWVPRLDAQTMEALKASVSGSPPFRLMLLGDHLLTFASERR